jgi:UDP-N-acetylglucosamine 2-epimerase (non-hydrolysing)
MAVLLLTDSGGVQEESCILSVPCVTLRENTERPETINIGSNTLAGTNPEKMLAATVRMREIPSTWNNPFGDGTAALNIIDVCKNMGTF